MRRLLSISLLLLFSFPLIAPLFAAGASEASLPMCCRRDGRHHCGMTERVLSSDAAQRFNAIHEKCPCYPTVPVSPHVDLSPGDTRAAIFAGFLSRPACIAQTEARRRISFDRSRQKRGPPSEQD